MDDIGVSQVGVVGHKVSDDACNVAWLGNVYQEGVLVDGLAHFVCDPSGVDDWRGGTKISYHQLVCV